MSDFNIDNIKNTWQQQKIKDKYSSEEILKMLNKKSRNYVKYIYWISLAELFLFTGLTIYYLLNGSELESFYQLLRKIGVQTTEDVIKNYEHINFGIKLISMFVGIYFVIRFYRLMKQVSIEENLKNFISKIISFRKAVRLFIIANILILIAYYIILAVIVNGVMIEQNIVLSSENKIGFIVGIIVAIITTAIIIWCYYKVIYGIIMNRLNKTLNQLQEIESVDVENN